MIPSAWGITAGITKWSVKEGSRSLLKRVTCGSRKELSVVNKIQKIKVQTFLFAYTFVISL